ncbi:phage tail tape measure protein [Streptomyces sp. NPDC018693]|uniref:phage tail tape measure protein n=1 Tax=unclassified Streptomyces TaxID=2593676 RepID=UPI0037AFBE83
MSVLDELLVRLGVDMTDAEDEIDRGGRGIEDRLNGLTVAGGVAAAGLGAAFVMGLESAMDISSVTTQLQNQLGLTDEEAARAGSIAGDVFSAGFGESMGDVGEALDSVASSMHEFGSISDAEMTQLTKEALALGKSLQFDVGEAAVGAGNLIKAGLAKDGTEAFDLMAAAAQQMPKAMREELPAVTKEYSEFFAQLGATGPEMMGALAAAAENPLFEIDKLGDAVKEFTLRISETDAVKEPLEELGLDVGKIQAMVNKGQGTKAFDEITKALAEVEDQTDRTRLAAALMGGPGEDAQASLKAFGEAGGFAANKLEGVAGKAAEMAQAMENSPAQQWDSVMRTLSTTIGTALLPVLQVVSNFMKDHPGLVQVLIPVVLALAAALAVAAAAQWVLNSALLANPIGLIILAIVGLVAAVVVLWKKNEAFRDFVTAAWDVIWGAIKKVWDWVKNNWPLVLGILTGPIGIAVGVIVNYWDSIVKFVSGLPGRISSAASGMWNGIVSGFKSAVNAIIYAWNRLSFTIGGGSVMGVSIPSVTLNTPDIPYLAAGGIATGPTLAMVGEGREKEAILPLSRLDQMLNQPAMAPSTAKIQPLGARITFEDSGEPFMDWLKNRIRIDFDGDVTNLNGTA